MKILFGMPAADSWGGPIASEPPFVQAIADLGVDVTEAIYVYGDKAVPTPLRKRIARVLRTAFRFRRILSSDDFDIVHLNTAFDLRTILRDSFSIFIMRPRRTKIFLKFHGSEPERFSGANAIIRQLIAYLNTRVDGFGVHTAVERDALVKLGFTDSKFHYVKNVVSLGGQVPSGHTRTFTGYGGPHTLLFISRFVPEKGLIETIRACSILRDAGMNFRLVCLGDGEMRVAAEEEKTRLGLDDVIEMPGYVSEDEVVHWLLNAELLVFPTGFGEGFPNVVFRAMIAGLPIVTTKMRVAGQYLDEPQNCLFCTRKPDDIAAKVRMLLEDEDLMLKMSLSNIAFGATLTPENIASEYMEVYRALLADR